jgi:hypothetical protein
VSNGSPCAESSYGKAACDHGAYFNYHDQHKSDIDHTCCCWIGENNPGLCAISSLETTPPPLPLLSDKRTGPRLSAPLADVEWTPRCASSRFWKSSNSSLINCNACQTIGRECPRISTRNSHVNKPERAFLSTRND